jgi:hypothetical protein
VGTDDATDSVRACTLLCGWTGFRCVGCRTGACASSKWGNGRACGRR